MEILSPEIFSLEILSPEILSLEILSLEIFPPEILSREIFSSEILSPEARTLENPLGGGVGRGWHVGIAQNKFSARSNMKTQGPLSRGHPPPQPVAAPRVAYSGTETGGFVIVS